MNGAAMRRPVRRKAGTKLGASASMASWQQLKTGGRARGDQGSPTGVWEVRLRERQSRCQSGRFRPSQSSHAAKSKARQRLAAEKTFSSRLAGKSTAMNQLYSSFPVWRGFLARRSAPARAALAVRW